MTDPRPTVLLLEDDADLREATSLLLEAEGYAVLTSLDFEDALHLARGAGDCVVLLDLSLRGDALAFVQSLHASPEFVGRVVLFSASDRLSERARDLGADGVLAKPFEAEELFAAVRPSSQYALESSATH